MVKDRDENTVIFNVHYICIPSGLIIVLNVSDTWIFDWSTVFRWALLSLSLSLSLSSTLALSLYLSSILPLCHSRIHRICSSSLQQMRPMLFRSPPLPGKQVNVTVIHHTITLLAGEMSIYIFLSLINVHLFFLPMCSSLPPSPTLSLSFSSCLSYNR